MDRREFLMALGTGAASFAAAASGAQTPATLQPLSAQRPLTVGRFMLELDGVMAGPLLSYEGGNAIADVVTQKAGPAGFDKKHIANVRYEEIVLQSGTGMSKAYYDWIAASWANNSRRHNGAVIALDFNGREVSRTQFFNALITEVGMPALDATSRDVARMTVRISPELTRPTAAKSTAVTAFAPKQKQWLSSNFRLNINGLEASCARVSKIEALAIKQKVTTDAVGDSRDRLKEPGKIEFPNLIFTTSESSAQDLQKWFEDFVIKGNSSDSAERTGVLEYLSPTLKDVYFSITFKNLGMFKLAPEKTDSATERIRRVKAEMYCEQMVFDYKGAVA